MPEPGTQTLLQHSEWEARSCQQPGHGMSLHCAVTARCGFLFYNRTSRVLLCSSKKITVTCFIVKVSAGFFLKELI